MIFSRFFLPNPTFVGLQISYWQKASDDTQNSLYNPIYKRADLVKTKEGWKIERLCEQSNIAPLPPESLIALSLPAQRALLRLLKVEVPKPSLLQKTLPFYVEPYLPFPVEESSLNAHLLAKDKNHCELSVLATTKEDVKEALEHAKSHSLTLEKLITEPEAIALFSTFLEITPQEINHLLYIEDDRSTWVSIQNNVPLFFQHFEEGSNDLIALSADLLRTSLFLAEKFKKSVEKVYLINASSHEEILSKLQETIRNYALEIAPFKPGYLTTNHSEKTLWEYAIAIGSSLAGSLDQHPSLLQEEFAPKFPWPRFKKGLIRLSITSFILFASLVCFTKVLTHKRGEDFAHHLFVVAENAGYTPESFCKLCEQKKLPNPTASNALEFGPQYLQLLSTSAQKPIDAFPYEPNIPKVLDLMTALSKLAAFSSGEIKIDALNYRMIEHPSPENKNDRYVIEVVLKFSASSPNAFKEAKDSLQKLPHLIDQKKPIKFTEEKGVHSVSFFLKDQTEYFAPPTPKKQVKKKS